MPRGSAHSRSNPPRIVRVAVFGGAAAAARSTRKPFDSAPDPSIIGAEGASHATTWSDAGAARGRIPGACRERVPPGLRFATAAWAGAGGRTAVHAGPGGRGQPHLHATMRGLPRAPSRRRRGAAARRRAVPRGVDRAVAHARRSLLRYPDDDAEERGGHAD